jgi:hypothetical protein
VVAFSAGGDAVRNSLPPPALNEVSFVLAHATGQQRKSPGSGAGAKVASVTGVTVTDRMLMDAGLSRQHRDSRNSFAVTFLQNQISYIIALACSDAK